MKDATDPLPTGAPTVLIEFPLPIRWRDLDAFNHVNNSSVLTWLEETRIAWLARLPGDWTGPAARPVVAAIHVNYRRQIGWPGTALVVLTAGRVGTTSLTIGHRVVDAANREILHADGDVVMVWTAPDGRPVPLPDTVRAAVQSPPVGPAVTSK